MKKTTIGYALVLFLTACAGSSSTDEEPLGERAQPLEQAEPEDGPRHGPPHAKRGAPHGGPAMLLHVALRELELSSEQRNEIDAQLKQMRPPMDGDRQEKREALAEAIRAGSIDPKKFEHDTSDHQARLATALEKLHATLTPEQRATLVAVVRDRMAERPPRPREGRRDRADMLLHGIDVSDEQRTKIDAALASAGLHEDPKKNFEAMKAKKTALLDAFADNNLDADAHVTEPPKPKFIEALAAIVPLLDQAQRTALAERIEQGPRKGASEGASKGASEGASEGAGRGGPKHRRMRHHQ